MKRILFTTDYDYDEFVNDNQDFLEDYCEEHGYPTIYDIPERIIYNEIDFRSQMFFEDELVNLREISVPNVIICFANVGRWNGRFDGYKILTYDLSDCLRLTAEDHDSFELYVDSYNLLGSGCHHDGTNYYEFRMLKNDCLIDEFEDAFYYKSAEYARKRFTKSLRPYIAKAYGWSKSKSAG